MSNKIKFAYIKKYWELRDGVVYSKRTNKPVSFSSKTSNGRHFQTFNVDDRQYHVCIHEAVFMLYHNRPIVNGNEIHHIDGDFNNNVVGNLIELTPVQHKRIHKYQLDAPMRGICLYRGTWRFHWIDDNRIHRSRCFSGINEAMTFRARIEEPRRAELRAMGLNCKRSGSGPTNGTIRKISRPLRTRQWRYRQ
ncbi:HNH endonuclease [Escherichia coli]|nr:HNH endonuclease [Escherichia coli]